MRSWILLASMVLVAGCFSSSPNPATMSCDELAAIPSSASAPLIPAQQGDPKAVSDRILAALGDARTGEWEAKSGGIRATTERGGVVSLWELDGVFSSLEYDGPSSGSANTERAEALMTSVLAALEVDDRYGIRVGTNVHQVSSSPYTVTAAARHIVDGLTVQLEPGWFLTSQPGADLSLTNTTTELGVRRIFAITETDMIGYKTARRYAIEALACKADEPDRAELEARDGSFFLQIFTATVFPFDGTLVYDVGVGVGATCVDGHSSAHQYDTRVDAFTGRMLHWTMTTNC